MVTTGGGTVGSKLRRRVELSSALGPVAPGQPPRSGPQMGHCARYLIYSCSDLVILTDCPIRLSTLGLLSTSFYAFHPFVHLFKSCSRYIVIGSRDGQHFIQIQKEKLPTAPWGHTD